MTPYTIRFTPEAERQLRHLAQPLLGRINDAITSLADNPRPVASKILHSGKRHWRIRVGDYRIIYKIDDAILLVLILQVDDRSIVYKKMK